MSTRHTLLPVLPATVPADLIEGLEDLFVRGTPRAYERDLVDPGRMPDSRSTAINSVGSTSIRPLG